MTPIKHFVVSVGALFLALWIGCVVITLLPEGTVALHFAACISMLVAVILAVMSACMAYERYERDRR